MADKEHIADREEKKARFDYLMDMYLAERATDSERIELNSLVNNGFGTRFKECFDHVIQSDLIGDDMNLESRQEILMNILDRETRSRSHLWGWMAAAVFMIAAASGALWMNTGVDSGVEIANMQPEILPGTNKAILNLADGTKIELNGKRTTIPQQGDARIVSASGNLSYVPAEALEQDGEATGNATELVYNTISTPRGGQYQLTLADGSHVWLNAASSLKFPASFSGSERVVELSGEAYFEIATVQKSSGKKMPFKVRMPSGAEVEVLGTHFNVMAYAEEGVIKTTLLEGSVLVIPSPVGEGRGGVMLSPNQQAQITKQGTLTVIKDYNVDEAVAWKNNKFVFKNTGLPEIMRQLSRWYDVEVVYENDMSDLRFGGTLSRKENASAMLNLLKLTGSVDFKIEGKKIIVKNTETRK